MYLQPIPVVLELVRPAGAARGSLATTVGRQGMMKAAGKLRCPPRELRTRDNMQAI